MSTPYLPTAGQQTVRQWFGTYAGIVVNNNDPTNANRVTAQVPQVLGTAVTTWAEPLVPGSVAPAPGSQIMVQFLGGDPDHPMYLPYSSSAGGSLVNIDTNMADIQPLAETALAGSAGKAADAGHIHPLNGVLISQTDTSQLSTGNSSSVKFITIQYSVSGTSVGTWYEIETFGNGMYENNALNMGMVLNGNTGNIFGLVTFGSGFFGSATNFQWSCKAKVFVATSGSSGTAQVGTECVITMSGTTSSGTNGNSAPGYGFTSNVSFNTTTSNTLALVVQWGGTTSGQQLNSYGSRLVRSGT